MKLAFTVYSVILSVLRAVTCHEHRHHHEYSSHGNADTTIHGIPFSTRVHWMRYAVQALSDLGSPCPFAAFGAVVVNHTSGTGPGELICIGANSIATGNPTLHGEIAAINNCTSILGDPDGHYKLSANEVQNAWQSLSLYTTAEPCAMCASAIAWGGFREMVYGTSIETLIAKGWRQIAISSGEVLERCHDFPHPTSLIEDVLANETDAYFSWQFNPGAPCPGGCQRIGGSCSRADRLVSSQEL